MKKTPVVNIVGIRCQPQAEEKFVQWYDQTHIPLLLKFKGLRKVKRCKIVKRAEAYPEYLGIFEFESEQAFTDYENSPELAAAHAEMRETWKDGGWDRMWRVQFEVVKTWGE
jgi:uncharacterized protein (TIGR02118 family)